MKPKNHTILSGLEHWSDVSNIKLHRIARQLRVAEKELPSELADIHAAVAACQQSIQRLSEKVEALFESDEMLGEHRSNKSLTNVETDRLPVLNRCLLDVTRRLRSVAEDATPRLEAKLADPDDWMVDYEIEAIVHFVLREDDPDYDEDDDNFLTTRTEPLKHLRRQEDENITETISPEGWLAEPHCRLFRDLYEFDYGIESPRLSFHDCARIGRILIDVQVWQQYDFNVTDTPAAEC